MPSLGEHLQIDRSLFNGREYPEVHKLLDQFAHFPHAEFLEHHRQFLHHKEGVEYIRKRWGEEAALAAKHHILADCENLPDAADYHTGRVDSYGYVNQRFVDPRRFMFHHEVRVERRAAEEIGEQLSVNRVMDAWDRVHES